MDTRTIVSLEFEENGCDDLIEELKKLIYLSHDLIKHEEIELTKELITVLEGDDDDI